MTSLPESRAILRLQSKENFEKTIKKQGETYEIPMKRVQLTLNLRAFYSFHKKVAYEILGLQTTAQPMEIKEAYLKLSKKFHPDVSSAANAVEIFKSINEAYGLLKKELNEETEVFSSGINKNPRYNFEESLNEDLDVYKRYTEGNEGGLRGSSAGLMRENFKVSKEKSQGRAKEKVKKRMNDMLKC